MGNCCMTGTNIATTDLRQMDEKGSQEQYRRESQKQLE